MKKRKPIIGKPAPGAGSYSERYVPDVVVFDVSTLWLPAPPASKPAPAAVPEPVEDEPTQRYQLGGGIEEAIADAPEHRTRELPRQASQTANREARLARRKRVRR